MTHKWMVLWITLILFGLISAPVGTGHAQSEMQDVAPLCPPYRPGLLQEQQLLDYLPPECVINYKQAKRQENPPQAVEASAVGTANVGDPDKFGYTWSQVPYSPIGGTTNTGLTGDDAFTGPINIGFSFPFYGTNQTQFYVNTNGLITFNAGSRKWGGVSIPNNANPNNYIAAYWDDLLVGAPYNTGGIYYARGGTAPNRYLVVEWRNIENLMGILASFEAVLYENGDIVLHHGWVPSYSYFTVGIEDETGLLGLYHQGPDCCRTSVTSVRFHYPTTPTPRVFAYSPEPSGFAQLNNYKDFTVVVKNNGTLGTDTYKVFGGGSEDYPWSVPWPITYYAADGVTPLSDTNGDGKIDTGPIAQGASTNIIVRFSVPSDAAVGEINGDWLEITSSLNNSLTVYVPLKVTIPAPFANVFVNDTNGAMSFLTASADRTDLYKATANNYFGSDVAMAQLPNRTYVYAWSKASLAGGKLTGNIEYALFNGGGTIIRAPAKLTDNSGSALYTWDDNPSVVVTPNGTVGLVWRRYLYNTANGLENYNIFFTTLNSAGVRITGPTNITNNAGWTAGVYGLYSPTITATSDNHYVIGWEVYNNSWQHDIWYAVLNAVGAQVKAPTALTSDHHGEEPILNTLTGGKVIITWRGASNGPFYAILTSNGAIIKPKTAFGASDFYAKADAVQLPNGKIAIAWASHGDVFLRILNSSYNLEEQTQAGVVDWFTNGHSLSITTDASSRIIMTWLDGDGYNKQFYALGYSGGIIAFDPLVYNASKDGMSVSWNGQGNAPYLPDPVISGNAGMGGVTLSYSGGSTTTDSLGRYSFKVPSGWSGTVTPSKSGYIFSPVSKTYSNVTTSQVAQDYSAIPLYTISGSTGVTGVTLSHTYGTPKTVTSQANGNYSLTVPSGWNGSVTPLHPCFTFSPANRTYASLGNNQTSQNYTPSFNTGAGCADVDVKIGSAQQGRFGLSAGTSTRASFSGVNNGPVKIESTNAIPLIGAERLIYKVNNVNTSFTEMMGLPNGQLDTTYWLPWYNNVDLDTQLRIANVSNSTATVHVYIGGVEMTGSPFAMTAVESTRKSFPGINNGPVKIVSDQNIVAAERLIYKVNNVNTSFTEMMALPNSQLDTTYWLPWYNNVDLDTQLRIANVTNNPATVQITIGGMAMPSLNLAAGESARVSYAGVNAGPVKIVSDQNIVAAERLIYKVSKVNTSFTEMMALPNSQLDTTYWLPWYNNADLDTQIRFANVSNATATVHVYVGGVEMTGSPFTLEAGESTRQSFAGINNGPVKIVSDQNIVAAERLIYKVNKVATSFTEMMALPNSQLDMTYWLPWYNNVDLDTQLRFGVP